jgi:Cytochrome c554 and c-prime
MRARKMQGKLGTRFPGWALGAILLIVGVVLSLSVATLGQQAATGTSESKGEPGAALAEAVTLEERGVVGDKACQACHQREFETYQSTRHHLDSSLGSAETIHGHFDSGRNTMESLDPGVSFRMDAKDGAFFETALVGQRGHEKTRTEKMDVVIGSGKKGQSYLYWRGDELFELPVSYWTNLDRWVNSPGYVDGTANFDRGINSRCLECHSTYFQQVNLSSGGFHFDKDHVVVGISCERCHGPGAEHVRQHANQSGATPSAGGAATSSGAGAAAAVAGSKMSPLGIERDRQIDICAQCHGGIGHELKPAFSFKPGDALASYTSLETNPLARVDVHGNQVALLEKSKCFQSSPSMTCSTCHNSHEPEHEAASYSAKCLTCHQASACPTFSKMLAPAVTNCVDCHMPIQESKSLTFNMENQSVADPVRNHWIRVYPSSTSPHQK